MLPLPDGTPLLGHTIDALFSTGVVDEVTVVTGYRQDVILDYLESRSFANQVSAVFNPHYASRGPVWSIASAFAVTSAEIAIFNGDTYFERSAITEMAEILATSRGGSHLFGSVPQSYEADDIKVCASHGKLVTAGKHIDPAYSVMKSAGVFAATTPLATRAFMTHVEDIVTGRKPEPKTWHECLGQIAGKIPIEIHRVPLGSWHEIDCPEDLAELTDVVSAAREMRAFA